MTEESQYSPHHLRYFTWPVITPATTLTYPPTHPSPPLGRTRPPVHQYPHSHANQLAKDRDLWEGREREREKRTEPEPRGLLMVADVQQWWKRAGREGAREGVGGRLQVRGGAGWGGMRWWWGSVKEVTSPCPPPLPPPCLRTRHVKVTVM